MEFLETFYSLSQPTSIHSHKERPRQFDHFGNGLNLAMCSVKERPRQFDHFGNGLNLAMCSVNNPIISL